MTKEEKEAVLHCLRAMIDEELCEECPLYGTTGTDHCEKDCVRLAIEELEQDEYIKVPKKALKYRTAGIVAYNAEWLKNHFDIERAVICGEQEPCEDKYIKEIDHLRKYISKLETQIIEQEPCEDVVIDKHYWKGFNNGIRTEKFRESKRQEPYEDCISRHEVLDVIDRELFKWDVIDEVRKLPPVTSQSKTGRWIHHKEKEFVCAEHWECSQCHRTTMTYPFIVHGIVNDNDYNAMYYCPKCGAKMVEDTGSEG